MCSICHISGTLDDVDTLGGLAAVAGGWQEIAFKDGVGSISHWGERKAWFDRWSAACLCGVDIPATFSSGPVMAEPDPKSLGDWVLRRRPASARARVPGILRACR